MVISGKRPLVLISNASVKDYTINLQEMNSEIACPTPEARKLITFIYSIIKHAILRATSCGFQSQHLILTTSIYNYPTLAVSACRNISHDQIGDEIDG